MPDVQEVGAMFPVKGVEATCEYGRQPEDTTASGANVRAFEPGSDRGRGGSRCGLTKFVAGTVNGDFPVQHLAILVDPQAPALNADNYTVGDAPPGYIADPSTNNVTQRNPGRYIPQYGSGRAPNRNRPETSDPFPGTRNITFTRAESGDGYIDVDFNYVDGSSNTQYAYNYRVRVTGAPAGSANIYLSSGDYTALLNASIPQTFNGATVVSTGSPYEYNVTF